MAIAMNIQMRQTFMENWWNFILGGTKKVFSNIKTKLIFHFASLLMIAISEEFFWVILLSKFNYLVIKVFFMEFFSKVFEDFEGCFVPKKSFPWKLLKSSKNFCHPKCFVTISTLVGIFVMKLKNCETLKSFDLLWKIPWREQITPTQTSDQMK